MQCTKPLYSSLYLSYVLGCYIVVVVVVIVIVVDD
jgi:hypothetical protein